MESMEFKELVEEMKEFFGVSSLEKVAEKFGRARPTALNWRNRKVIPDEILLEYNRLKAQAGLNPSFPKKNQATITFYPNIRASAGHGLINDNEEHIEIDTNLLETINLPKKKLDMIQVQGDSMHPYVENGDFALIDRSGEAKNGDIVIANYQGDLYVKQIQKNPQSKSISLISSNKNYPSFEIRGDEVESLQIIGVLKAIIRTY